MNAKIFKGFDNEAELRFLEAGKKLSEMIDTDFVAVVNDKEVSKDYEVQEGDKIIVRALPHLAVVAVAVGVAAVGMVVGSVVAAGAEAYKQQKRANELIEDLQKRMNKQRDGVASLPFLRGATNQVAQNRTQPYIIGEHLFTPYLQTEPFYQIGGTDGERQYYVAVLQAGFNKQVIRNIQADDVKLKTFAGESPQEGVFNLDAGLFYDPNAVIEIAQDGADFSTGIFNQKIKSQIIGAELKKSDHPEYIPLVQTLDQCAMSADISISIKGLKTFNTDGTGGNRTVVVIPEYSVNNGSTWTEFYFNQNGSSSNTFTRNTNRELRFVAHLDLNYNTVKDLPYPVQVRLRCTTPKVIEGSAYDGVYLSWIQSRIYNPDKSKAVGAFVADKIIDLPEASMSTLIGVKLKATEVNQDKLKSINILTAGMARTWNGSVWSGSKSTTRNLAAWLLEILTSDTHKASKLLDSEIDLAAFGEFYNYCATNNIYYDRVLVDGVPKELLLQSICSAAFSILYRNIYGETSVAWDSVKDNAIAILNTQNMVNFTVEKNFERRPDGTRINFINKAADYQMDSYLVMDTGKTRDANSVIRDMSLDGKVDFSAIVKDARRMMANDKLRPRIMRATIGMEGTYYKPFTRIKVQHPALSNGLGSATIKDLLIWDTDIIGMELYEPIEYNSSVADGFGVVIQCVDVDYCTPMAKQYTAPENGMVDKIYFSVPVPIAETVQPHIGDVLSYGYLKSGAFDTITSEMMIVGIEPDNKLVNLTLVDYNEAIYATGVIPEYTPNLTYYKDVFPSEPGIPAPSLEEVQEVKAIAVRAQEGVYRGRYLDAHPEAYNPMDSWTVYHDGTGAITRGVYYSAAGVPTRITTSSDMDLQAKLINALGDIAWCESNDYGTSADYGIESLFQNIASVTALINTLVASNIFTTNLSANTSFIQNLFSQNIEVGDGGAIYYFSGSGATRRAVRIMGSEVEWGAYPEDGTFSRYGGILGSSKNNNIVVDGTFVKQITLVKPKSATVINNASSNDPSLIQQSDGQYRVVYRRNSDGYLVQRLTVNGAWQSETVINNAISSQPSLIQQSDGQYRVVYCRTSDGYLVQRLTVNGAWQSETVINNAGSYQPSLIQQSDGQYRVVYRSGPDGYLMQRLTVNGAWQSETVINNASSNDPSLIQQSDGEYRVVYRRDSGGYLVESIHTDQLLCELGAGIIESGVAPDGSRWQKTSDGMLECWGWGYVKWVSGTHSQNKNITFPSEFSSVDAPDVFSNVIGSSVNDPTGRYNLSVAGMWTTNRLVTPTGFQCTILSGDNGTNRLAFSWHAKGLAKV